MSDVFISYSRVDRPIAERLAAALEARGASVWMDKQLTGGSTFTDVTEEELNRSAKVIVLWSETSIKSGWVRDEAQAGREQGKLVPLSIDGSQPPMGFRQIHMIDVVDWANGKGRELPREVIDALALDSRAGPDRSSPAPKPPDRRNILFAAMAAAMLALAGLVYVAFDWYGAGGSAQSEGQIPVLVRGLAAVGGSDEDAALASGITDELILRLRRIEGLRIASARADGSAPSAEFENAHAMEGSIRRSGESLRTTIRLLDPSGAVLWSETYDRTINELLQVQEETAAAIANALSVSLDVGVNSRQYGGTNNPEAFSSYVLGVVNSGDPEAKFRYFQRATELDPNYTQALSALTDAHWGRLTAARSKDEMERILAEADAVSARAFNSRPQNAYSFMARGVYLKMANDLQGGDEMFRRAAELDPGYDPIAKLILASHEQGMGRVAKARRLALAAEQIDPVYRDDPWMTRFLVYSGRYDEAIALSERIGRTDGQVLDAPLTLHAMILAGETRKAREFARNVPSYRRIEALFAEQPGLLAMSREDLRGWAKARYGEGPANELWPMAVSAALGGNDAAAMRFLQVATELSPPGVGLIWHPAFAKLRPTKDFKQLVQDVGLDKIWRASGEWGDHCRPLSATDFECS